MDRLVIHAEVFHNRRMHYETIERLKGSDFKRLTGIQRKSFDQMLKVVEKGLRNFGKPGKPR